MKTADYRDVRNIKGQVTSKVNPLLKSYSNNLSTLQSRLMHKNDELISLTNKLSNQIESAASTLDKLKGVCTNIAAIHTTFNTNIQVGFSFGNQSIYQTLSQTFKKWSSHLMKQSLDIQENLVETFNYTQKELNCLNDVRNKNICFHHF